MLHTHTQSFLTSGDYQDEDDEAETPLAERLEKYKSKQENSSRTLPYI